REAERTEQALRRCCGFARATGTRGPSRKTCLEAVREQRSRVCALLKTWVESMRDYQNWRTGNAKLYERIAATVSATSSSLWESDDADEAPEFNRQYEFRSDILEEFCAFEAHWAFIDVLRNPLRNDIASCDRCGSWFLNRSGHRNKRFCKRRCAVLSAVTRSQ